MNQGHGNLPSFRVILGRALSADDITTNPRGSTMKMLIEAPGFD
jgi:hypothetical protein